MPEKSLSNSRGSESLREFFDYINKKKEQDFWGEVLVKFRNGVPYLIREVKQIKLSTEDND